MYIEISSVIPSFSLPALKCGLGRGGSWLHSSRSLSSIACTWAPLGWPRLSTRCSITASRHDLHFHYIYILTFPCPTNSFPYTWNWNSSFIYLFIYLFILKFYLFFLSFILFSIILSSFLLSFISFLLILFLPFILLWKIALVSSNNLYIL